VRLVVLGFGLIGGSVALAARDRGVAARVVGIDRADVISSPEARNAADDFVDAADESGARQAMRDADLVLVATPVGAIEATVGEILDVGDVVTDCGSTKRAIVAAAARSSRHARFVPGHPMAGLPQGGIRHANKALFEGRPWLLCAEHSDRDAVERVEALIRGIGAEPQYLSAEEHDRAVALTSHVPQLFASALAVLADTRRARATAGPGFESATRTAGGGEAMWRDILATNADEITAMLDALGTELDAVSRALRRVPPDLGPALNLLERARAVRSRSDDH
jgi:prephenate dehydrogenase